MILTTQMLIEQYGEYSNPKAKIGRLVKEEKEDILPFIKDTASLNLWSADFFRQITEELHS